MNRVALLLATYNGEVWLEHQLSSILTQVDISSNLFISDDFSIDKTPSIIVAYTKSHSNVAWLPSNKRFGSAAANFFRLLRDADFSMVDYVALCDQDDIWLENKLSHAIASISQHNVDAYSSNVLAFWPDGTKKLINKAQPQQSYDYMFESAGPGCTFVLTKTLALKLQEFLLKNEVKCQSVALHDWFIYAYARSNGYKWFIDPTPHMLYRQHAENVVGANVGFAAKIARWKKLRAGWLVDQALLIASIVGYSNSLPMQKLARYHFVDRLWLIINITKLRRRMRDRIALVLFLLLPLKR